jgi:sulfide:quinone oxidoreductase
MSSTQTSGRHVVVVGGSFAGLGAAYTLRDRLHPTDRVTLVSANGQFIFAPSLVWAALGQPLLNSSFSLDAALTAKGIDFIRATVHEVRPADHVVVAGEEELRYDRLVIATGGRPDTSSIPGLAGEFRSAGWIVGEDSARDARAKLEKLYANPGPLIIGAAQGASYITAAYELALSLDAELRKRGIRDRVSITFVTSEPYLGHLGFGQTAARPELERLFADRSIQSRVGVTIDRVNRDGVKVSSDETLPASASIIMPPFTGSVDIWKSANLTTDRGIIPVGPDYRHIDQPDIYAAGVASSFIRPVPPLTTDHAPHTGYLSVRMGKLAGQNAAASLGCGAPASRTLPYVVDVRVLDGGDVGLLLTSRGNTDLQNTAMTLGGRMAHTLKATIERYLLWRLRNGRMDLP